MIHQSPLCPPGTGGIPASSVSNPAVATARFSDGEKRQIVSRMGFARTILKAFFRRGTENAPPAPFLLAFLHDPPIPLVPSGHRGIPASSVSELLPVLHRFWRRSKRTQQTESCSDKVRLSAFDFHIVIFICTSHQSMKCCAPPRSPYPCTRSTNGKTDETLILPR